MPAYAYVILAAGWLFWLVPFLLIKRNPAPGAKLDHRARWGVLLEALAYSMLWWGNFWTRSPQPWRIAISVFFFLIGGLLSWTSASALGRQWRIDASLNPDHQLVRSGAYRIVRHPIYTSMFCMLLGTGFMITLFPMFLLSILLFIIGTQIRVRIEDTLLASRFGDEFRDYQRAVSAYIPFVK